MPRDARLGLGELDNLAFAQRRIDMGQTTLIDIFGGLDDSPAAVRLREQSQRNLEALAQMEPPQQVADELAAAESAWQRLRQSR